MNGGLVLLESAEDEVVELVKRYIDDVFAAFLLYYHLFGDYILRVRLIGSCWD